jgi:molybdopterin-containing oxidoreductase family iron-sulfur binding subunit
MSDSVVFNRRDFLKLAGLGVAAATAGCSSQADKLIPYLVAPNDILPGVPYWYASTCTECSAGCGILAKSREGRVVKIEGNPEHPVSRGGLCARGQAALQGLYNPDRIRGPMVRQGGKWMPLTWDEALKSAIEKITVSRGGQQKIALLTNHQPGSAEALFRQWAQAAGGTHLVYEPLAPHALREANQRTYGVAAVPILDLSRARMIVSFGADFLETWGVPVSQARDFAAFKARPDAVGFVAVEPRLSLTGANADEWIAVRPGGEMALALSMANVIVSEGLGSGAGVGDVLTAWSPEATQKQTDVPPDVVRGLARRFAANRPSLAVAGGVAAQSEQAVATIAAVNLLNHVAGNVGETVRFDRVMNDDAVAKFTDVQSLANAMERGEIGALVVHDANPAYAAPVWSGFVAGMAKVPFKLSLSSVMDETTSQCDMVLPTQHALEMLGDRQSVSGVYSLVQPAMAPVPLFDARPAGDTLIALGKGAGFGGGLPASWKDHVETTWRGLQGRFGQGKNWDDFWTDALKHGGVWETPTGGSAGWTGTPVFAAPELRGQGDLALVLYASPTLYDGRGADKPWLQELPDPTTKIVWGSWVEIHPETAGKLGIATGDNVKVETEAGSVTAPAYLYAGIRKDTIAIPLGQGHTELGRFAQGRGVNALALIGPAQDAPSGSVAYLSTTARVSRVGGHSSGVSWDSMASNLAMTQRYKKQSDRDVAQIIPISALMGAGAAAASGGHLAHAEAEHEAPLPSQTRPGKYTEPRAVPAGYVKPAHAVSAAEPELHVRGPRQIPVDRDSYSPKQAKHRWAMAIDLDRCTGCSACVVACNAENNVPYVGPDLVRRGREMMWLRIERYEEKLDNGATDIRFLPMLCQHCSSAPCETVCPVYATYHNPEGLNAQVYNRCVGTRYCSNNCPYKVRTFNFFDYSAPEKDTFAFPEPLNWQLNPDVTVRSKGVMEKCTFCVQRILEGKGNARDESRPLRDLEIQTACQQSCPSQAIVFGDLLDPASQVSKLSWQGERRYWALNDLNTKPAITYLKKIDRGQAMGNAG